MMKVERQNKRERERNSAEPAPVTPRTLGRRRRWKEETRMVGKG